MWDIGCDFQHYGGFTRDFGIAVGIDTGATLICIGVGAALAATGVGAVALLITGVAVGTVVGLTSDYAKNYFIGY